MEPTISITPSSMDLIRIGAAPTQSSCDIFDTLHLTAVPARYTKPIHPAYAQELPCAAYQFVDRSAPGDRQELREFILGRLTAIEFDSAAGQGIYAGSADTGICGKLTSGVSDNAWEIDLELIKGIRAWLSAQGDEYPRVNTQYPLWVPTPDDFFASEDRQDCILIAKAQYRIVYGHLIGGYSGDRTEWVNNYLELRRGLLKFLIDYFAYVTIW